MTAGHSRPADVATAVEQLDGDGRLRLHSTLLTLPFEGSGTFDWQPYITATGDWIEPPADEAVTPWTILTRFGRGDANWEGVKDEFPKITYAQIRACIAWGFATGRWLDARSFTTKSGTGR